MLRVAIETVVVAALVILSYEVFILHHKVNLLPTMVETRVIVVEGRATPPLTKSDNEAKAHFWANKHIEQELKLIELKTRRGN